LLARAAGVSCPITAALATVLAGHADVPSAMAALLDRPEAEE
jgi:glycerol-3-phosphate dehydrogenase